MGTKRTTADGGKYLFSDLHDRDRSVESFGVIEQTDERHMSDTRKWRADREQPFESVLGQPANRAVISFCIERILSGDDLGPLNKRELSEQTGIGRSNLYGDNKLELLVDIGVLLTDDDGRYTSYYINPESTVLSTIMQLNDVIVEADTSEHPSPET